MVDKLNLPTTRHPKPYEIRRGELKITEQVLVSFSMGEYHDEVLCDVVPMDICHILLGRSWQVDRGAVRDWVQNTYTFRLHKRKIILHALDPHKIQRAQPEEKIQLEEEAKEKAESTKIEEEAESKEVTEANAGEEKADVESSTRLEVEVDQKPKPKAEATEVRQEAEVTKEDGLIVTQEELPCIEEKSDPSKVREESEVLEVVHDGSKNTYTFHLNKKKVILQPLEPHKIRRVQQGKESLFLDAPQVEDAKKYSLHVSAKHEEEEVEPKVEKAMERDQEEGVIQEVPHVEFIIPEFPTPSSTLWMLNNVPKLPMERIFLQTFIPTHCKIRGRIFSKEGRMIRGRRAFLENQEIKKPNLESRMFIKSNLEDLDKPGPEATFGSCPKTRDGISEVKEQEDHG